MNYLRMVCPTRVKKVMTSRLIIQPVSSTAMNCRPYFDDSGEYHHHDKNNISMELSCTQGHKIETTHYAPCPAKDCEFGGKATLTRREQR